MSAETNKGTLRRGHHRENPDPMAAGQEQGLAGFAAGWKPPSPFGTTCDGLSGQACTVVGLHDGKIQSSSFLLDQFALLQQTGALPQAMGAIAYTE